MPLAENSFNYGTLGEAGFEAIARLLDQCTCYDFTYSRLEDALEVFEWLANSNEVEQIGLRAPVELA
jgi:hypothetical protein